MAFKTKTQVAQDKIDAGYIPGRRDDFLSPPFGGRPPSDEAVHAATQRYIEQEKRGELHDLPKKAPTHRW
jgi:hypothetical protein